MNDYEIKKEATKDFGLAMPKEWITEEFLKQTKDNLNEMLDKTIKLARADEREKCLETHPRLREEWANKVRQAERSRIRTRLEKLQTFNAQIEKDSIQDEGYIEFYKDKHNQGVLIMKKELKELLSALDEPLSGKDVHEKAKE